MAALPRTTTMQHCINANTSSLMFVRVTLPLQVEAGAPFDSTIGTPQDRRKCCGYHHMSKGLACASDLELPSRQVVCCEARGYPFTLGNLR